MQEQLHKAARYIDGIEILQYSLSNAPKESDNQLVHLFNKGSIYECEGGHKYYQNPRGSESV